MSTKETWMELVSPAALIRHMEHRGETVRTLAAKSVVKGPKGRYRALSPAIIGHLRSGHRKTCSVETATAIEKALDVPPDTLFHQHAVSRAA